MNRKLPVLLLTGAVFVALLAVIFTQGGPVRAAVLELVQTTGDDFNSGTLYHTQLAPVDDGAVALQSIGLAGGWNAASTAGLPARFYQASTHVGTHIYVFGGQIGLASQNTCFVATILPDHSLSSWSPVTSLPEPLTAPSAATIGNFVYVIGGYNSTLFMPTNRVYRAQVNPANGSLSAWTLDSTALPMILDHAAATMVNGYIYVTGGETDTQYSAHTYYAHPDPATGITGPWLETQSLPGGFAVGVVGHVLTSYANKVFIATGLTQFGTAVQQVWSATVNADGTLAPWVQNQDYSRNLTYAAGVAYGTPQCGGNLYLTGGSANQGATATDYVATAVLAPPPDYLASSWYETSQLGVARFGHSMVVSDDGWLYVIDGSSGGQSAVDSVRYGETACAAQGGQTRAPDGQFTSFPFNINQTNIVYSLQWNTSMPPTTQMTMTLQYRYSTEPTFQNVPFSEPLNVSQGISQTGQIPLNVTAQYVQYKFNFARGPTYTDTPYLNWVKLTYEGTRSTPTSVPTIPSTPLPTSTPGPASPSPTPPGAAPNLIADTLGMDTTGSGCFRPCVGHPIRLNATVRNVGLVAVPAGSALEVDFYTALNRPPVQTDPSTTFGRVTLTTALQPGQAVVVPGQYVPIATGSVSLYGWANKNHLVAESSYADNITGPMRGCIYLSDGQSFTDVTTDKYYYTPVEYLSCLGIISGYNCGGPGEPCDSLRRPYFRWSNTTTRGQFTKIMVNGLAWPYVTPPAGGYTFADVPPTFPFFVYIETARAHNAITSYPCGGANEPCDAARRPYFRGNVSITRADIVQYIALGKGWPLLNPPTPTFRDVPTTNRYYRYVETVVAKGVISGYNCGATGEPCPGLYFRPTNNAVRGQIAKVLYFSFLQR